MHYQLGKTETILQSSTKFIVGQRLMGSSPHTFCTIISVVFLHEMEKMYRMYTVQSLEKVFGQAYFQFKIDVTRDVAQNFQFQVKIHYGFLLYENRHIFCSVVRCRLYSNQISAIIGAKTKLETVNLYPE